MLFIVGVAYAWTEPSANPPTGNTSSPLTVSTTAQIKAGNLILANNSSNGPNFELGSYTTVPFPKYHYGYFDNSVGTLRYSTPDTNGNATPKFVVDYKGNVGIKDTNPDNPLALDVEGYVGAQKYCNENGTDCHTIAEIVAPLTPATGFNGVFEVSGACGSGIKNLYIQERASGVWKNVISLPIVNGLIQSNNASVDKIRILGGC